jgi:hypothetical protein
LRRELGTAAAEHVKAIYAVDQVAARLSELYSSLGYPPAGGNNS